MSDVRLASRWLLPTIVILLLPVIDESHSANVDKVVIVMPKGPRTLQMLGSISPQLLHTISDVLKPVPSNVVQIPIPYYPDGPRFSPGKKHHYHKQIGKVVSEAYFRHPLKPTSNYLTLDLQTPTTFQHTQPGPYDTPFVPMLKPSPINPLHLENPPEIKFTPINLLPSDPPSFSTVRNYVQKLKEKQKAFFDNQGYDFGFSSLPPPPSAKYKTPYTKALDYKKKTQRYKYTKPSTDYLFSSHPNELSFIGHANLKPQEEQNVYYTEPDAGQNYYYANAEGHEFVIPPNGEFQPVELDGIIDPDDAHFEQKGEELLLKTKHPNAAVLTPAELSSFSEQADEYGFSILHESKRKKDEEKKVKSDAHHRNKRFKKIDRVGRASGVEDVEEDFYDSDEGKKKHGELDFDDDVDDEVKAMVNFEPKKTYVQVRHEEKSSKKARPADEPKVKEKVTVSKTNIVYSEKGKETESFDQGKEESFGEFQAKSKKPKKHRAKRDVAAVVEEITTTTTTTTVAPSITSEESASQSVEDSLEQNNSLENEVDYELWPETDGQHNDSDTILLPYAQALVFQNETDMILLPIPEALVDPRDLQGDELLNFLDEAIQNTTQFLPEEKEKKRILISPEIRKLQGEELIQYLDDAIKVSNQYLLGPGDAIELVKAPRLDKVLPPEPLTKFRADHEIEIVTDVPKPEEVHGEVIRYTRDYTLPDAPLYEEVNFVQPFNTLIKYHSDHEPVDYEIEIEAQNPRELHGDDLLRFLDEALDNTTYVIPPEYEESDHPHTPYLNRAYQYVDVDTALKFAENVTNQLADYLQARNNYKQNEVIPENHEEETVLVSDGGFVPIRRADSVGNNVQFSSSKQAEFVGVAKDTFKGATQQKQPNPGVVVYNDVIRHIKNHLSSSSGSTAKTKDRNTLMIAVPRSLGRNRTRQSAARRQDSVFDTLPKATLIQLPIFDINKFYPTFNVGGGSYEPSSSVKQAVEKEAERVVTAGGADQVTHENKPTPKVHNHDDIADAFRDVHKKDGGRPRYGPNSYIPVQEKTRDYPQPTFRKPGPPYTALPVPPVSFKSKTNNLNTASSGQRSLLSHPPPQHPPLKRPRSHGKRPRHKNLKRVPVVRKKVRIIKS